MCHFLHFCLEGLLYFLAEWLQQFLLSPSSLGFPSPSSPLSLGIFVFLTMGGSNWCKVINSVHFAFALLSGTFVYNLSGFCTSSLKKCLGGHLPTWNHICIFAIVFITSHICNIDPFPDEYLSNISPKLYLFTLLSVFFALWKLFQSPAIPVSAFSQNLFSCQLTFSQSTSLNHGNTTVILACTQIS